MFCFCHTEQTKSIHILLLIIYNNISNIIENLHIFEFAENIKNFAKTMRFFSYNYFKTSFINLNYSSSYIL